jgi:hypothetical protein
LYIDAERKCVYEKVEVDRKKTLISSNVKYFKLSSTISSTKSSINIKLSQGSWEYIQTNENK